MLVMASIEGPLFWVPVWTVAGTNMWVRQSGPTGTWTTDLPVLAICETNHIEGTWLKVDSRFGFVGASCAIVPKSELSNLLPILFCEVSKLLTPHLKSLWTNQRVVLCI